jgi:CBS domain-containing protein
MAIKKEHNLFECPSCGATVIEGSDSCPECLTDLRSIDIPETAQGFSETELNAALSELRLSKPLKADRTARVAEVIELLRSAPDSAVVVSDGGKTIGIFTERDILNKIAGKPERLDDPVFRWMTSDPVVLRETDTMAVALNKMGGGGFRHIPLVNGDEVVGLVTASDVMQWVMSRYFD